MLHNDSDSSSNSSPSMSLPSTSSDPSRSTSSKNDSLKSLLTSNTDRLQNNNSHLCSIRRKCMAENRTTCSFMETLEQIISNVFKSLRDNNGSNNNSKEQIDAKTIDDIESNIFKTVNISEENKYLYQKFIENYHNFRHKSFQNGYFDNKSSSTSKYVEFLKSLSQTLDPLCCNSIIDRRDNHDDSIDSKTNHHHHQTIVCDSIKNYLLKHQASIEDVIDDNCAGSNRPNSVNNRRSNSDICHMFELLINKLIISIKQIEPFTRQSCNDQILLLRKSLMPLMIIRSLLIRNQSNQGCGLKRQCSMSDNDDDHEPNRTPKSTNTVSMSKPFNPESMNHKTILKRMCLEQQQQQSPVLSSADPSDPQQQPKQQQQQQRPSCIFQSMTMEFDNERINSNDDYMKAKKYEQMFEELYAQLVRSIDHSWIEDKNIFHLLFAIVLFQPSQFFNDNCPLKHGGKSIIFENLDQIRQEYYDYIEFLQCYLRDKYRCNDNRINDQTSNQWTESHAHFIRLFIFVQQVYYINQNVIKKLWILNMKYAYNLLKKIMILNRNLK